MEESDRQKLLHQCAHNLAPMAELRCSLLYPSLRGGQPAVRRYLACLESQQMSARMSQVSRPQISGMAAAAQRHGMNRLRQTLCLHQQE